MPETPEKSPPRQFDQNDAFFVLRECRAFYLRRLADMAKLAGVTAAAAIDAFTREAGKAHDELVSESQQGGFGETLGLTASRISLVGNDQLELEIRIGGLTNHLKDNQRIDPWRTQLRYMSLLNRPQMLADRNPAGFEPISCGLFALCAENGHDLEKNLDLLDKMEAVLQTKLPELYFEMNALLERHRVPLAQAQPTQRNGGVKSRGMLPAETVNTLPANAGGNPLSTLHMAMQRQLGGENRPASDSAPGNAAGGAANFTLNASALVMLNHLLERLDRLEIQQNQGGTDDRTPMSGESNQPAWRTFNSKDLDLPLGQPAAVVLDTLSLIFEAIFAAPELPDTVKTAIGRLQIPLLRMAITDHTFFNDTQHPARRLINRMAQAALGLSRDTSREHPVCANLTKLAESVRATLEKGDNDLSPLLDELEALIAERDRQIQDHAAPYIQLVIGHEAAEAARSAAQTWLKKTLARIPDPTVSDFLTTHWFGVMQTACLGGGATGERWRESEAVIDELLASFQPIQTAEERKQLIAKIPLLVKRISAILDRAGIPAGERTPFFDACFERQTAALRNRPGTPPPDATEATPSSALISPLFAEADSPPAHDTRILEQNGTRVRYLGKPGAIRPIWQKNKTRPWKEGDWIELRLSDNETYCGQLCREIPDSGTLLLFNPDQAYAVATPPAELERQIENGQAHVVSGRSLFDEAAKQALDRFSSK